MDYKFSGHETFPCRYAWLPKAAKALQSAPRLFADETNAMVELGVGKNMVRAIKFWVQASNIAASQPAGELELTELGKALFGPKGLDPYLEDLSTLWLIHWKLATGATEPLFAWDYLFNRWQSPEISGTAVLNAFKREAIKLGKKLSSVTLSQHFDVFMHTYVPTRGRKVEIQEDNVDCPLNELALIEAVGMRELDTAEAKREVIYAFRREAKPEITPALFIYCLNEFWTNRFPDEKTLPFREIAHGHGAPGQIFKLPEEEIRNRLHALSSDSRGKFHYQESLNFQQVQRRGTVSSDDLLQRIYR